MSWNNGVFTRDAGATACQDESNGGVGVISSVNRDADINDLVGGINLCWLADGTKPITGNLNLNGYNLLNVGEITADGTTLAITANLVDFSANIQADAITATGGLNVSSGANINGGLQSYGNSTFYNDLNVQGGFSAIGTFSVSLNASLLGGATLGDELDCDGNNIVNAGTISGASASISGVMSAGGLISANGGFYSATTIESDGLITANAGIDMNNSSLVDVDNATLGGDLAVSGTASFSGNEFKIASNAPATPTSQGAQGAVGWDDTGVYVCTDDDTWQKAPFGGFNDPALTKQSISGTGTQTFDLDDGWLADSTISGSQTIDFENGSLGANGIIKLINTNGNTFDLSGTGLTFKRSNNGVLEVYSQITLEAGATTEQIITYHFQSATEVIYTVS